MLLTLRRDTVRKTIVITVACLLLHSVIRVDEYAVYKSQKPRSQILELLNSNVQYLQVKISSSGWANNLYWWIL